MPGHASLTPLPAPGGARPRYRVGTDGEGHWVAVAPGGLAGGLFRTREAALRYAGAESGCRPADVPVSPEPIRVRF